MEDKNEHRQTDQTLVTEQEFVPMDLGPSHPGIVFCLSTSIRVQAYFLRSIILRSSMIAE
jgi:hypothetical protein